MPNPPLKGAQLTKAKRMVVAALNANNEVRTSKKLTEYLTKNTCLSESEVAGALHALFETGGLEKIGEGKASHLIKWKLGKKETLFEGIVIGHRSGYYRVENLATGEALPLVATEKIPVLPGDRILATPAGYSFEMDADTACVEKLVARARTELVCRTSRQSPIPVRPQGCFWAEELDPFSSTPILVRGDSKDFKRQAFVVELNDEVVSSKAGWNFLSGTIKEILGDINSAQTELEVALRRFDLPHVFSEATLREVSKLPETVQEAESQGRIDLRDIAFVTIDGEDARDFDDAVWAKREPRGWRLLVAIADVSHYVKEGSALDRDAQSRATSVYFPRCVVPMLPEKLSNGLCSLNPDEDRLTLVCDMMVSEEGLVDAYQFYPAIIRSHARLTYTSVQALLDGNAAQALERGAVQEDIVTLDALYEAFRRARAKRGAIDFESVEPEIVCGEDGKIQSIGRRTHTEAHRIIEECMLAANTCAADLVSRKGLVSLYRVHDVPSLEKLETLQEVLAGLGVDFPVSGKPTAQDFNRILSELKGSPQYEAAQLAMLRAMQQAVYSPVNIGHYGLNYQAYAHFTSPIRRYPDLLLHRTIHAALSRRKYTPKLLVNEDWMMFSRAAKGAIKTLSEVEKRSVLPASKALADWKRLGLLCSAAERRADEASRDVVAWLKCVYMKPLCGMAMKGVVTGINRAGLYVTLNDVFVEGFVHVSRIGADYYEFDEATQTFQGESTGQSFGIGTKFTVRVLAVDVEQRSIDFEGIQGRGQGVWRRSRRFFDYF